MSWQLDESAQTLVSTLGSFAESPEMEWVVQHAFGQQQGGFGQFIAAQFPDVDHHQ